MSLELSNIVSGYNLTAINNNFEKISNAWGDKLDRIDGVANQMESDLDMNGYNFLNVTFGDYSLDEIVEFVDDAKQAADYLEDLQEALASVGYDPIGTWKAGLTFTNHTEVAFYNGVAFRLKTTTPAPYTAKTDDPTVSPDSEYVRALADAQMLVSNTVDDMKLGRCLDNYNINAALIESRDMLCKTISYRGSYDATKDGLGGATYILTTKERAREILGDTWEADGYVNHYMFAGDTCVAILVFDNNSMTVEQAGAYGDGVTDDTAAIQAAGDCIPEGGTVYANGSREYKIKYDDDRGYVLYWKKPFVLDWCGATVHYQPWSSLGGAGSPAILFEGDKGDKIYIEEAGTGERFVTLSNPEDINAMNLGEWYQLKAEDPRQPWNYPLQDVYYEVAELRVVRDKYPAIDQVVFDRTFDNSYSHNAYVQKLDLLDSPVVKNVNAIEIDEGAKVSGYPIDYEASHFISFELCYHPHTDNIHVIDNRLSGVWHSLCVDPLSENIYCETDKTTYSTFGGHSYGVRFITSRHSKALNVKARKLRHCIDYSSSHDGYQENCWAIEPQSYGFSLHGTGEARVVSYNDGYTGQASGGWQIGNPDFNSSHDVTINDFNANGQGIPIWVLTNSYNVEVNNLKHKGVLNALNTVRLTSGAHDIKIDGARIDMEDSSSTNYAVFAYPSLDSSYSVPGKATVVCNTPGVTPLVTFTHTADHNLSVGDTVYANLRYVEYQGEYTVTEVIDARSYVAQFSGTTSGKINRTFNQFLVWPAPNWKPVHGVKLTDFEIKAAYPIYLGGGGNITVSDGRISGVNPDNSAVRIDSNYGIGDISSLKIEDVTCEDTINSFASLTNCNPDVTYVRNNRAPNYTKSFIDMGGTAEQRVERLIENKIVIIENNKGKPSISSVGFIGFNVWDALRYNNNFTFRNNEYPQNASINDASFNVNWEYGYFAPTIYGSTVAGNAGYTNQQGTYKLDNRDLKVKIRLTWTSFTGSGQMRIKMPYTNTGVATPVTSGECSLTYIGDLHPVWNSNYIALRSNSGGQDGLDIPQNVPVQTGDMLLYGSVWLNEDASEVVIHPTPTPEDFEVLDDFEDIGNWSNPSTGTLSADTAHFVEGAQGMRIKGNGTNSTIISTKNFGSDINVSDLGVVAMAVKNNIPMKTTNTAIQFGNNGSYQGIDYSENVASLGQNTPVNKFNWVSWDTASTDIGNIGSVADAVRIRGINSVSPYAYDITIDNMVYNAKGVPTFVIGFDDGYTTIQERALPYMKSYGLLGTAYIPVDFIGQDSRCMDWPDVLDLYDAGWAICLDGSRDDTIMLDAGDVDTAVANCISQWDDFTAQGINSEGMYHMCYPNGRFFDTSNTGVTVAEMTCNGTQTVTLDTTYDIPTGMSVYGAGIPDGTTVILGGIGVSSLTLSNSIPTQVLPAFFLDETVEFVPTALPAALEAAGMKSGRITGGGDVYSQFGFAGGQMTTRGQGFSSMTLNQAKAWVDLVVERGSTIEFYAHTIEDDPEGWDADTPNGTGESAIACFQSFFEGLIDYIYSYVADGKAVCLTKPQWYERDMEK